jgi:hypothetical protein
VSKLSIDRTVTLTTSAPAGSRHKGYEEIIVQDIVFKPEVTLYRRERWATPDGRTVTADLPAGVMGGCGPHLHRLVLMLHCQGQMTCERIVTLLTATGLAISKRQVVRLLTAKLNLFRAEEEAMFSAGRHRGSPCRAGLLHDAVRLRPVHGIPHRTEQIAPYVLAQSPGRDGALRCHRGGRGLYARGESGARRHRCAQERKRSRIRL